MNQKQTSIINQVIGQLSGYVMGLEQMGRDINIKGLTEGLKENMQKLESVVESLTNK